MDRVILQIISQYFIEKIFSRALSWLEINQHVFVNKCLQTT